MEKIEKIPDIGIIKYIKEKKHGFVTDKYVPLLIAENRLQPVMVRCGGGRFTCPVQDLQHFIKIIERDNRDYIRDVSIVN